MKIIKLSTCFITLILVSCNAENKNADSNNKTFSRQEIVADYKANGLKGNYLQDAIKQCAYDADHGKPNDLSATCRQLGSVGYSDAANDKEYHDILMEAGTTGKYGN
jgi:hypothetical protein